MTFATTCYKIALCMSRAQGHKVPRVGIEPMTSYMETFALPPCLALPMDQSGLEVIKLFSSSAQLRLKFILLINVKMPTIVGILTFMSRINY